MKSMMTLIVLTFLGLSAQAEIQNMFTCQGTRADGTTRVAVTIGVQSGADGLARGALATVKVNGETVTPNARCVLKGAGLFCPLKVGEQNFEIYPVTYNLLDTPIVWGVNIIATGGPDKSEIIRLVECTRN